jgi:hypothetical protein
VYDSCFVALVFIRIFCGFKFYALHNACMCILLQKKSSSIPVRVSMCHPLIVLVVVLAVAPESLLCMKLQPTLHCTDGRIIDA